MSELLRHRHTVEQYGVRVEIPTEAPRISLVSIAAHAPAASHTRCSWPSWYESSLRLGWVSRSLTHSLTPSLPPSLPKFSEIEVPSKKSRGTAGQRRGGAQGSGTFFIGVAASQSVPYTTDFWSLTQPVFALNASL